MILAATKLSSRVVMTEAAEVMDILTENVDQNKVETPTTNSESDSDDDDDKLSNNINGIHGTSSKPVCPEESVSVRRLRWDCLQEDVLAAAANNSSAQENDLKPNSFDTIVGTDVVFSPSLVCPLLETIKLMARKKDVESTKATRIYLCLQVRCADSHSLLFSEAHKYGLEVVDVTGELTSCCPWAVELECLLLKINVKEEPTTHGKKRKKSSKEKKSKKTSSKEKKSKKKDKKSPKRRKRELMLT
uniref:Calmodulin-lysine N-methyltransferase n=1 Tax=Skeletonema marinoi TaxID=267567 RepID=A0A7S2PNE0_9STRA